MGNVSCSAKLIRPSISACLPRERVFRVLDDARRRQLIWIGAPAGSGKTTLASSYVQERRLPALWYEVDRGDGDIATFFHYLAEAGRIVAPRHRRPFPALTPEYLPGLPTFSRRFFEDLLGRLKAPSLLVFDNCQEVPADAAFHMALLEGVTRLPEGICVVLVSREAPPPIYARRRANEGMEVIGWPELRLTPDEASGIARLREKGGVSAAAADALHARADGWAAGLVLFLEAARLGDVASREIQRRPPDEIVDYFGSEVLRSLELEVREFLLRSAFLPHMTAGMAAAVTGEEKAGRILAQLHRRNCFTQRHPGDDPTYQYHALFRDFLLTRAVETFPREEARRLRQAAAGQLEAAGWIEDAAALYREAADAEGLARIVMSQAPHLLAQGRGVQLLEWIGHLPAEAVEANPWLLCWKGLCLLPLNPEATRPILEMAYGSFRERKDATGVYLSWCGRIDAMMFGGQGDFERFDSWIAEMDVLLREHGEFPSQEIETRVTSSMMKALYFRGLVAEMDSWAHRAEAFSRGTAPVPLKIEALFSLALYRFSRGDMAEFDSVIGTILPFLQSPEAPPLARLTAIWMEAVTRLLSSRFERSLDLVAEGLAIAEKSGVHVLDAMLLGNGALAQVHLRNHTAARDLLDRMEKAAAMLGPWPRDFFHFVSACDALRLGDTATAAREAEIARSFDGQLTDAHAPIMKDLLSALIAHARGGAEERESHLAGALSSVPDGCKRAARGCCALVSAYLGLEKEDGAMDTRTFASHLRVAREVGHYNAYIPLPGLLERLVAAALAAGVEVEYAREIIRRNRLRANPSCADLEAWPWPVKVRTLGSFELLQDERPVEFPRKVQQKPLLLLKALIAAGGREVPQEQLIDALWPDADGDLGHQAFTAALHRLRKLLGAEDALVLREGRLSLSGAVCWVDAWAFDRRLARAGERAPAGGSAKRRAVHLEQALALYRGPFLPEHTDGLPLAAQRDRLRRAMLRAAEELGGIRERERRWDEAVACYRRAFEADESSASICRKLVASCLKCGREAEAARAHRRCEEARAAAGLPALPPDLAAMLGNRKSATS